MVAVPWRKSQAKKLLSQDIIDGIVTPAMDAATVYKMRPEYNDYPFKNFKPNLKSLRLAIAKGPKPPKWRKSAAKELLRDEILSGAITPTMDPEAVHSMKPEWKIYPLANFKTNLKNLRQSIEKDYRRMEADLGWYNHDRKKLLEIRKKDPPAEDPEKSWHKSNARVLLKQDIDAGLHTQMKPSEIYQRHNGAYKEFPPDVFRKHVHQEVQERASRAHRFAKKKLRQLGPPTKLVLAPP